MEARHCPPPGGWAVCGGGGGGRGGWSECRAGSGKLPPPSRSLQVGVGPGRVSWLRGLSRPATLSRPRPAGTGAAPLPPPPLQPPGGPGTPRLRNGCCCRPAEPGPRSRRRRPRRAGGVAAKAALGLHGEGRTPLVAMATALPPPPAPARPLGPVAGPRCCRLLSGRQSGLELPGWACARRDSVAGVRGPPAAPPRDCHLRPLGGPQSLGLASPPPPRPYPRQTFPPGRGPLGFPAERPSCPRQSGHPKERRAAGDVGGGGRSPVVHSPPK